MLGYDSYSKSIFGLVTEQRVRFFLTKRRILNIPLFNSINKNNSVKVKELVDALFPFFEQEIQESFYEYAFAALISDEPNYDFLTNDEAESILAAENALKNLFAKILKTYLEGEEADVQEEDTDNIFNFLKNRKLQREVPRFENIINIENYNSEDVSKFKEGSKTDILSSNLPLGPTEDLGVKDILDISPFYIEFFSRIKPDTFLLNNNKRYRYSYFNENEKVSGTGFTELNENNTIRGARLMFNLTSALVQDPKKISQNSFGSFNYNPLNPSRFLPFFPQGGTGKINDGNKKFLDEFALPFLSLSTDQLGQGVSKKQNLTNRTPYSNKPSFLYTMLRKVQNGNTAKTLNQKSPQYFIDLFKEKKGEIFKFYGKSDGDTSRNVFYALKKAGTYPNFTNWDQLLWSKSLYCFEKYSRPGGIDDLIGYFPMIISEVVDTNMNQKTKENDEKLVKDLLSSDHVKLLNKLYVSPSEGGKVGLIQKTIDINEENLKKIDLFNQPSQNYEEMLDNMLTNLINFDEE